MVADVEPPELARLLDYAERPRHDDWSFRAALCRYAQPQPQRVGAVLELVRRIEFGLHPHSKTIERTGSTLWHALTTGEGAEDVDGYVVGLLDAMAQLDRLGEVVATWAVDRAGDPPDAAVDAAVVGVARRLEALGVPREERVRPPRAGRG